jgi:hypothetical protein
LEHVLVRQASVTAFRVRVFPGRVVFRSLAVIIIIIIVIIIIIPAFYCVFVLGFSLLDPPRLDDISEGRGFGLVEGLGLQAV